MIKLVFHDKNVTSDIYVRSNNANNFMIRKGFVMLRPGLFAWLAADILA